MSEETPIDVTDPDLFRRYDEGPDQMFYVVSRMVTHIDEKAVQVVTQLYRELLPPGGAILDLMSSWVSHLPPEVEYSKVVGLGMNVEELTANPRLTRWLYHDLNHNPRLHFETAEFDAAAICVSIQYLTHPVDVLRELARVVRVGGPLIITFSNRCFPTKAVWVWQYRPHGDHIELVSNYLEAAGNWTEIQGQDRSPSVPGAGDPLFAVTARSAGPAEPQ